MYKDLTGQTFERLLVLERAENKNGRVAFLCKCNCGNVTVVTSRNLIRGITKSCGCLHKEQLIARNKSCITHGDGHTRLYSIYNCMKYRCYNKNGHEYKNYGGRGIAVCIEWLTNYNLFKSWALSHGYRDDLTIDRIDVNKDYSPDNCRWITKQEQSYNRTDSRYFEYNGEKKCLAEWAKIFGINKPTLYNRVYNLGWDIKRALETKVKQR